MKFAESNKDLIFLSFVCTSGVLKSISQALIVYLKVLLHRSANQALPRHHTQTQAIPHTPQIHTSYRHAQTHTPHTDTQIQTYIAVVVMFPTVNPQLFHQEFPPSTDLKPLNK